MANPKRNSFGTRLLMNFLPKHFKFWNLRRNFRGRSKYLHKYEKKKGREERTPSKILAFSQRAMQSWCWKSRQGQDALYKRLRPGKRIRTKSHFQAWKRTEFYCERWQAFGFCNDDFCNKAEGKKGDFCRFSMTLRTVISVVVQIQKVTFCKKRWLFCIYRISQFDGHSTQCSQLTIMAVFARLRKLQCF